MNVLDYMTGYQQGKKVSTPSSSSGNITKILIEAIVVPVVADLTIKAGKATWEVIKKKYIQ